MLIQVLFIVIGIALIYWINHIRKKKIFKRHKLIERTSSIIKGFEIQAFLSLNTALECLRQDGMRFGESFRLKECPILPHNEQCKCKIVELTYTSNEVFQGALREHSLRDSSIGLLKYNEISLLKDILKSFHQYPLPINFEEFCGHFSWEGISQEKINEIKKLIHQKFESLQEEKNVNDNISKKRNQR